MIIQGQLTGFDGQNLKIIAPFEDDSFLVRKHISECEIRLLDGRTISVDQRKKIYATMRDISIWSGHVPDEIKALAKYDFIAKTGCEYFSLSDCDMTTANEFLTFLIEFCIEWDIPTLDSLLDRSPDIARYLYCCLANKKCVLCGKKADLHHVDAVGAGRDRKEIIHKGMHALSLCRKHHTEFHTIGKDTFFEKYHLFGIKLDDYLCQVWKVKGA